MKIKKKIILIFLIACAVFFHRIIFTELIYFQRDIIKQFKPWKVYIKNNLAQIVSPKKTYLDFLPLWNHYNHCGAPLMANLQSQVFYPLGIVFYVSDFAISYKIFILMHSFLAMAFMYLYLKSKKLDEISSLAGGLLWGFNGYMMSRIEFLSVFATVIWLPLIVLLFEKTFINGKPTGRNIVFLSVTLAMQFLAGHAQMWGYSVVFLLLYSFVIDIKRRTPIPTILTTLCILGGLFIAGIQFLPTAEFFFHSTRAGEKELGVFGMDFLSAVSGSLNWYDLKNFFYPFYWTTPFAIGKEIKITPYWIYTFYIGFVGMLLFFIGWINKKLNEKKFLLTVILIFIFYAVGENFYFYPILYHSFPPVRMFRYPGTAMYVPVFIFVTVAAYGINLINGYLCNYQVKNSSFKVLTRVLNVLILLFVFGELYIYNQKISLLLPESILSHHSESARFLSGLVEDKLYRFSLSPKTFLHERAHGCTLYRAMQVYRDRLYGNLNLEYNLYNFYGQDITLINFYKFADLTFSQKSLDDALPMYGMANVKYILSTIKYPDLKHAKLIVELPNSGVKIYENPYVMERVYFVSNWLVESNLTKSCEILSNLKHEISNTAILHTSEHFSNRIEKRTVKYNIKNFNLQTNRLNFDIECSDDGLAVISQSFYPGWKCKVNGKITKLLPANIFMTAIPISKGYHRVELTYEPLSFKIGCILTAVSISLILFYFAILKFKTISGRYIVST